MEYSKQKMMDVLEDTVKYYSEDPKRRAAEKSPSGNNYCLYLTPDGRKCAVGRLLDAEDLEKYKDILGAADVFWGQDGLNTKYGLPLSFVVDLQKLHDTSYYWDKEGLTETGETKVEGIKDNIESGGYKS